MGELNQGVDKLDTRLITSGIQNQVRPKVELMAQDTVVVEIAGQAEWKCFRAKGGNWVAVCDPLHLTVQSETWANLVEDIAHTMNDMFVDLLKSNELEQFLRDRGWQPVGRPLGALKPANVWFDLPFVPRPADRDTQVALR